MRSAKNDAGLDLERFSSRQTNDFASFVTVRKGFFFNRVREHWNVLPNGAIHAFGLNQFKARIDSTTEFAAIA